MRRIAVRLAAVVIACALLAGCWDRHELNDLGIVSAIGFDKKGDKIQVTVQILDPSELAGSAGKASGSAAVVAYEEIGVSVDDAIGRLTVKAPYPLYLSHTRMVIIGEEMARKDGVGKVMDYLSRERQMRTDFFIILAKKAKASEVLGIFTPITKIPGNKMYTSLETSAKEWAPVKGVHLVELINDLVTPGKQLALTGIRIEGDRKKGSTPTNIANIRPAAKLMYIGLGVFRGDKLVGWLNEEESKGYKYIQGEVVRSVGFVECGPNEYTVFKIIRAETKRALRMKDDKPFVTIHLRIEADVNEQTCDLDLSKPETIDKLQKMAEKKTVDILTSTVRKAQEIRSDFVGFGNLVERKAPRYWRKHESQWADIFPELEFEVKVSFNIRRVGTKIRSFLQEKEE
ncbi:Ger(x)C family spore germination protein [Paenibacillus methanolicus]|uniref:Spore germination protein KC n=1 Tax=Paenibacillus methanolicus TaxID=582686 RepID=A0A5S5C7V2_9BACL|nr:Ger(x)C family spore germination protein [Paenibacillus methanolicus]TYP75481.1 spore germination protein KC [Paenibacillus methanolicus]